MNESDLNEMANGYMECSLFTDLPDGEVGSGEFSGDSYFDRFPKSTKAIAKDECKRFFEANAADLSEVEARRAGHDLWYTRNGHGTGFWDRSEIEKSTRDRLANAARRSGERHLYRTRGGWFKYE